MKSIALGAAFTVALPAFLIISGCSRTADQATRERTRETADTAYVRFINAHTGPASLYFGDSMLFSGSTKTVTDYKPAPAERKEFSLRSGSREGEALATNSEGLDNGAHYTVIAFNGKSADRDDASLRVVKDDEEAPSPGKAKVRMIHASPEFEALNLYAVGHKDEIADQSRFSTGSTWQEVDPVKGPLEVRSSDRETGSVRVPDVTLEAGKLYTFVVSGGDDTRHKFAVTTIVDTPKP
jgi:hypothetical protein